MHKYFKAGKFKGQAINPTNHRVMAYILWVVKIAEEESARKEKAPDAAPNPYYSAQIHGDQETLDECRQVIAANKDWINQLRGVGTL
jgi:hypothetical protein